MRTGVVALAVAGLVLAGCGGGEEAGEPAEETVAASTGVEPTTEATAADAEVEPTEDAAAAAGDACALLDPAFLDDLMEGETTMVGAPYAFQEPVTSGPSDVCTWKEGSTGLSLQVTLEPAATSVVDDHSERAYNIDSEPVPVPQDGPGASAVLLTDTAFAESTGEDFPYGYFFVADDVTVYLKSVGLEVGGDRLRAMADEAADRLAAG